MFQSFESPASPDQGPPRLASLRARLSALGLDGFLVPRADVHQGEYVAPRDERLQWLTGFTGSAGFCIVLPGVAGVFIDGRYRARIGFDPWLHTADEIAKLETALEVSGVTIESVKENPVDAIWPEQPDAPLGKVFPHPDALAGEGHSDAPGWRKSLRGLARGRQS